MAYVPVGVNRGGNCQKKNGRTEEVSGILLPVQREELHKIFFIQRGLRECMGYHAAAMVRTDAVLLGSKDITECILLLYYAQRQCQCQCPRYNSRVTSIGSG